MLINKLRQLHYKELFVYGSFISIIVLGIVGTIVDALRNSYDVFIDLFYTISTYLIYRYSFRLKKIEQSATILFWLSTVSELAFLYSNKVDFDLVFALLIPIIAFVSMPLRRIIINLTLYYFVLVSMLVYFYFQYPNHLFLHNFKYMFAYFMAHGFIIIYGFLYHLGITESINRLECSNQQNKLLLKEIHHRVKNNLNLMASILGLQEQKSKSPIVKEALAGSRGRIESMAALHEVLYKNDRKDSLNIKKYIDKLIINIIHSESSTEKVKANCEIDEISLTMSSMIQFGIMLNEMVTNSIKYVKAKDGIIKITLSFEKLEEGYRLIYCDNGVDIDLDKLQQGFGYNLIKLTVEQFNGEMNLTIDNGLCYNIYFKELEDI